MVRFKLFSISFTVSFWFFTFFALMVAVGVDAFSLLTAMAIHETGHVLPLLIFGGRVDSILLSAFGVVMQPSQKRVLSNFQDAVTLFLGPFFGLIAALLSYSWGNKEFALLNLGLSLFNLLPLEGLDGRSLVVCYKIASKPKSKH